MLILYVVSVVVSWFLFRTVYIIQGEAAEHDIHGFTIISLFIPYWNVGFPLLILAYFWLTTDDYKFNYKRFFFLTNKKVNK